MDDQEKIEQEILKQRDIELRYSCLQLAKDIYASKGKYVTDEDVMKTATNYYNWIKNN